MSGHHISNDDREQHMRSFQRQTKGHDITLTEVTAASPVPIPQEPEKMFALFLATMFQNTDCIELKAGKRKGGNDRVTPTGNSVKLSVREWCNHAANRTLHGVVPGNLGAFIRINPVIAFGGGSGIGGETMAADIARWPYCLIEHDEMPVADQVRLIASLRLPVAAIVDSGGKSLHAWLRVNASDGDKYKTMVRQTYNLLDYFGFDRANKDASRLARVPGFRREDKPDNPGWQKLLYLNSSPTGASIFDQIKELNSSSAQ